MGKGAFYVIIVLYFFVGSRVSMIEKQSLQVKQKKSFDVLPLISFAAMALLMVVIFAVTGITPFGSKSWLISDLAAQYAPALASYRDIFSGEGLSFFSFRLGMGKSIVGFFAYYLSSPLNLISFLFPKEKVSDAVSILILLKLSFAASFMTWLLDRKFSEKTKMSIPFGISYALCSFSLIFMFNIMWLDGFAILPLLILLVEDFRKDRRSWGKVTLVLVVLFASGYYIAYMVGVFSFLYMLCVMGYEGKLKTKDDAKTVGLFILSAGVAAMVCAALLVPAGLDTIRNGDNSASTAITLDPSFKLIDFIPNLFLVNLSDISTNLPYVFVNLTVLSLNVLFFLNETIPAKLRRLVALALGIFLMCFMFEPLNLIWHAFNSPDSLLYRYSFLVSFVMVLVAFYSFQKLKALCPIRFAQTAGILFAFDFGRMLQPKRRRFGIFPDDDLCCSDPGFALWSDKRKVAGIDQKSPEMGQRHPRDSHARRDRFPQSEADFGKRGIHGSGQEHFRSGMP